MVTTYVFEKYSAWMASGSAHLGSVLHFSARIGSVGLGSAKLSPPRLGSGSPRLGSARLKSARPGHALLGPARLGSARLGSARLGSARARARLGSARLPIFCPAGRWNTGSDDLPTGHIRQSVSRYQDICVCCCHVWSFFLVVTGPRPITPTLIYIYIYIYRCICR